jgi:phage shock protein PspC (stress-responsive transcriptional regulator)
MKLEVDVDIDAMDVVDIVEVLADGKPVDTDFTGGGGSGGGFDIGVDFDLDELLVVIVALAAVLAGLIASLYIVFTSPSLFAEVLLDGALSVGLYKRLKKLEQRHWLQSAIKKTWVPFLVVLLFFFIAGLIMQNYVPGADSIGDVWEILMS